MYRRRGEQFCAHARLPAFAWFCTRCRNRHHRHQPAGVGRLGGWAAVGEASYRGAMFNWAGALVGGILFGIGAILAGGCAGRTVVSAGEGNLSAWITLVVFAVVAMSTYYGLIEPLRAWFITQTAVELEAGSVSLSALSGMSPKWTTSILAIGGILFIVLAGRGQRDRGLLTAGAIIGALIVVGWWVTGYLGVDEFATTTPSSLMFSRPLAQSALAVSTGEIPDRLFGPLLLIGAITGAALMALISGKLRIISPRQGRYQYSVIGGTLMGFGAMMAGGCNIGQLSAVSTCSVTAIIAISSMLVGIRLGLYWFMTQSEERSKKI